MLTFVVSKIRIKLNSCKLFFIDIKFRFQMNYSLNTLSYAPPLELFLPNAMEGTHLRPFPSKDGRKYAHQSCLIDCIDGMECGGVCWRAVT